MTFKRLAALGVAAAVAVAVTSGAATAHSHSAATEVLIDGYSSHYYPTPLKRAPNAFDFYGRVLSPKKACTVDRRLNFYRDDPGTDTKLGHATSDSNGGWSFLVPLEDFSVSTDYYATAPKRKLPHHKSCHAATSEPFTPGP